MWRKAEGREEDFLNDLLAGMPDDELMEKYKLTPRGLGTLLRNLVNANVMSFRELIRRCTGHMNLVDMLSELREGARKQLRFLLPVSDRDEPENTGYVYDISEDGIGTRGLRTKIHEIKTLVIPVDDYFRVEPIVFVGHCRWVEEVDDRWEIAAGFRIGRLIQGSFTGLLDIIRPLNPLEED
jgi:hypothetical protein